MNNILNIKQTIESTQALAAQQILNAIKFAETQSIQRYSQLINLVWSNPNLTPQQVCDSLGTSAAALFNLGSKTYTYLIDCDPSCVGQLKLPTSSFIINSDGTITIN